MSRRKYNVSVTNKGVGDPSFACNFQFTQGSDSDTTPTSEPITNLVIAVAIQKESGGTTPVPIGSVQLNAVGTDGPYIFVLPYDDSSYDPTGHDTLNVTMTFSADENDGESGPPEFEGKDFKNNVYTSTVQTNYLNEDLADLFR